MEFCLVFNEGKKSFQEIKNFDDFQNPFFGKEIFSKISGKEFGKEGFYEIRGGTTKGGIPMVSFLKKKGITRIFFKSKNFPGFQGKKYFQGIRKKKAVHGAIIDNLIFQINLKKVNI